MVKVPDPTDVLPITQLSLSGMWSNNLSEWLQSSCRGLEALELLGTTGWGKEVIFPEIMLRLNADTLRHLVLHVPSTDGLSSLRVVYCDN